MTFKHSDVRQRYERVMALEIRGLPDGERPVFALMDAYDFFRLIGDDRTTKIEEIISHLLSSELRPALRSWYHRAGDKMNPAAIEFRDHLSQLAGEKFS
jgi:hypothetical protein